MAHGGVLRAFEITSGPHAESLCDAVAGNLRALCNSRLGASPSSPLAGLPDPAAAIRAQPAGALVLKRAVLAVVERCEPRIQRPRVDILDTDSGTGITMSLRGDLPDTQPAKFTVRFDPDGAAEVTFVSQRATGSTHEEYPHG